jgi:phytoene desaturase
MSKPTNTPRLNPHLSTEGRIVDPARYAARRACVIGAGFGGLALAIRLQSAGIATTIVEARDKPGGQAYSWEREGFTFGTGPGIGNPDGLRELWQESGQDLAQDVELIPVSPFCRFHWEDGTSFDYSGDADELSGEIAKINPVDVTGFEHLLEYSARLGEAQRAEINNATARDFRSTLRSAPVMARNQAWRSCHKSVSKYIEDEKLRQAFSCRSLLLGANPMAAGSSTLQYLRQERDCGLWWPRGGVGKLVAAMVRHFERIGGTIRLHDPAVRIHTIGKHATEVETQSGWRERFDAVASNTDLMHCYRDLLGQTKRGSDYARSLARKRFSPSLFIVHFGIEGAWPGIPHHSILFGPRYRGLIEDIYTHGVLPADSMISLYHPTVTDPSLAPEGKSAFCAMVPVANMGRLAVDWETIGPMLEKRVLDEIERRLIPDIHQRIVTKFSYTPRDFAMDLSAYLGSAFSLESGMTQSGLLRPHNRDQVIENLYLVGAGTHPGAGVTAVVRGAKLTAGLMLKDLEKTR